MKLKIVKPEDKIYKKKKPDLLRIPIYKFKN